MLACSGKILQVTFLSENGGEIDSGFRRGSPLGSSISGLKTAELLRLESPAISFPRLPHAAPAARHSATAPANNPPFRHAWKACSRSEEPVRGGLPEPPRPLQSRRDGGRNACKDGTGCARPGDGRKGGSPAALRPSSRAVGPG